MIEGKRVCAEDISYGYEEFEVSATSINDIKKFCENGIIIWASASGKSPNKESSFLCAMEYKGFMKKVSGLTGSCTSNQSMLYGVMECVKRIVKPSRIFLVATTKLGFVSGFRGKGPNAELVQVLAKLIAEKDCQLTEVQYFNGADEVNAYLGSGKPRKANHDNRSENRSKQKYYAVANGRKPGIYRSWDECNEQVHGFFNAKYKSFPSEEEAMTYFDSYHADNDTQVI